jgi:calcineurin-like phosphoesterase family protein
MTKIFIYTDTHFNHPAMKGFRGDNYENKILRGLERIPECDMFIHLGDVSCGNSANDTIYHDLIANSVNAMSRVLVLGNHDKRSISWYLSHGWSCVVNTMTLNENGRSILFSHAPVEVYDWMINIHGHLHNEEHRKTEAINDGRHILISLEENGYNARNLATVIERYERGVLVF